MTNLEGSIMQGFSYGDVSPFDFIGIAGWWRSELQSFTLKNNAVTAWKDISGNNRNMAVSSSGVYFAINPVFGYYLNVGGDGSAAFYLFNGADRYWDFLVNGSAFTVMLIHGHAGQAFGTSGSGSYAQYALGASNVAQYTVSLNSRKNISQPATGSNVITALSSSGNPNGQPLRPATNSRPGNLIMHTCYGNDGLPLQHKLFQNENTVPFAQGNYTNIPSSDLTLSGGFFQLNYGSSSRPLYEIIVFHHVGKSRQQIDEEMFLLRNTYIQSRYPGINKPNPAFTRGVTVNCSKSGAANLVVQITISYMEAAFALNYNLIYVKGGTTITISRSMSYPAGTQTVSQTHNVTANSDITNASIVITSVTPNPVMNGTIFYSPAYDFVF